MATGNDFDWHQQELAELQRRKERMARLERALTDGDTQELLRIRREIHGNDKEKSHD